MTPYVPDAGSQRKPGEYRVIPMVRTIMSTFNGERFLPELLTSVCQKTGVTVGWWIRDDGSTESTREVLTDVSSQIEPISPVPVPVLPEWQPRISLMDGRVSIEAESQEDDDGNRCSARELGLWAHVRLLGTRQDVPLIYAASDIAGLTSRTEGLPCPLLEAGASGLPVFGNKIGGIPEVIEDGSNGLLFESGNAMGLAHALDRLVRDRNLREFMGQGGTCQGPIGSG